MAAEGKRERRTGKKGKQGIPSGIKKKKKREKEQRSQNVLAAVESSLMVNAFARC